MKRLRGRHLRPIYRTPRSRRQRTMHDQLRKRNQPRNVAATTTAQIPLRIIDRVFHFLLHRDAEDSEFGAGLAVFVAAVHAVLWCWEGTWVLLVEHAVAEAVGDCHDLEIVLQGVWYWCWAEAVEEHRAFALVIVVGVVERVPPEVIIKIPKSFELEKSFLVVLLGDELPASTADAPLAPAIGKTFSALRTERRVTVLFLALSAVDVPTLWTSGRSSRSRFRTSRTLWRFWPAIASDRPKEGVQLQGLIGFHPVRRVRAVILRNRVCA